MKERGLRREYEAENKRNQEKPSGATRKSTKNKKERVKNRLKRLSKKKSKVQEKERKQLRAKKFFREGP